ncbi:anthranilate synthase component I [Halobaculum magnesiiphilum]|uniref:Anthranilate synthase component 1 n=1 Tax=Halobaculum magnesiiphilum TaxID=1017351 RepID=A0A8T8WG81_9EURY|nr:anthranilate synthase component I [Halobaculum magnesiiphilum]QZP38841.1 anthranilate synthase component I [Halobaculum magnesiiphilum]
MTREGEQSEPGVHLSRSREAFVDLVESTDCDGPCVVHATAELGVDVEPLTAYAALADRSNHSFLLESAEKVASSDPDGAFAPSSRGRAGTGSDGGDARSDGGTDGTAERHARYSFVGYDPEAVIAVGPDGTDLQRLGPAADYVDVRGPAAGDTVDRVRAALPDLDRVGFPDNDRQTLDGGLVGFLAYDAVYDLWLGEVGVDRPDPVVPDAEFVLTTRTLAFDDREGSVSLVFTPIVGDDDPGAVYDRLADEAADVASTLRNAEAPATGGVRVDRETAGPREEYEDAVRETKEAVLDGEVYQGVISRTRTLEGEVDDLGLYESLRAVNPSPYMYLLRHGDRSVIGASPETLVSVDGDRVVSNPIAGTIRRGTSPVEDRKLAGELLADGKERAEHTMLVDLARNDVRRVSEAGSVRVEEFMNVLKYSHVQHIESTVTGTVAADADAFDATRATFPAGTLTGAPKVRAMELIDELELEPRGVYGGGVGYYSWTGDADFAIVIRTATVEHGVPRSGTGSRATEPRDGGVGPDRLTVRAGAGVVADSDPASEYEETEQKMAGVLDAVDRIRVERAARSRSRAEGSRDDETQSVSNHAADGRAAEPRDDDGDGTEDEGEQPTETSTDTPEVDR